MIASAAHRVIALRPILQTLTGGIAIIKQIVKTAVVVCTPHGANVSAETERPWPG